MSKKAKIILISILLLIFIIAIVIIAVFKNKPKEDNINTEHKYAVNETKTTEDTEESTEEKKNVTTVEGKEIINLNNLTAEQYADRNSMYKKLHNRVSQDETDTKKAVKEEISDMSTEYRVYVSVTFSDDTTNTYVLGYDCTDMHSFLRCVSQEEWDAIMSGENLG